ncbi:MAG: hypothetical protein QW428_03530 [Conexivisphaerales archaeon]
MQLSPAGMTSCTSRGHRRSDDEQATFRVVALNGRNRIGHIELFIFVTNTYLKQGKLFRNRWGIETSYRMINKFLANVKAVTGSVPICGSS